MKTLIDSSASGAGATIALLNGVPDFVMCDLWQITLNGGTVILWHGAGVNTPISFAATGGQSAAANGTYLAGPVITRGKISTKLGVEVASLDATFAAAATDLINGTALIPFAQGRGFDGALVTLYRAFIPSWAPPIAITGVTTSFSGRVTELKNITRSSFQLTVKSQLVLLNVSMGPDVYQAGCLNTHYDAACGLSASNVAGTVGASASTTSIPSNLTNADDFFDLGTITFTSGANNGLKRAVKKYLHASGTITVAYPLPVAPSNGDTFNAVRGCLLTMADCSAQSNLIHFRGQPFIPPAISGLPG